MSMRVSIWILSVLITVRAAGVDDPAAPKYVELSSAPLPEAKIFERLTFHRAPKPLHADARTSDWPRLLGPEDAATTPETHLLHDFSNSGPALVWEVAKGEGYASPAIAGGVVVIFHAIDGRETIEALDAENGRRFWIHDYPIVYRDRYGFANGPRGSPVITGDRVVTQGVTSVMTCLDLKTGRVAWQRDLKKEFNVPQDFFGQGGTPLVFDGKVIVNLGGRDEPVVEDDSRERAAGLAKPGLCVAAFDLKTGRLAWGVRDVWGASYASPVRAKIHGRDVTLIYAGGESNPAIGGLLCVDPDDGKVLARHPWRAKDYIQATGCSPVVIPEKNRVFISTAYPKGRPLGGVMLELDPDFKVREVWKSSRFAAHFSNQLVQDGFLYGIDGETDLSARLVCFNALDGSEQWRQEVTWEDEELTQLRGGRRQVTGIYRASLLKADGQVLCLGETGALLWLELTPDGMKIIAKRHLFHAPNTWCPPAISRGLLYVMQNEREMVGNSVGPRLLCFDLRGR